MSQKKPNEKWTLHKEIKKTKEENEKKNKKKRNEHCTRHFCPNQVGTFVMFPFFLQFFPSFGEITFWWVWENTLGPTIFHHIFFSNQMPKNTIFSSLFSSPKITPTKQNFKINKRENCDLYIFIMGVKKHNLWRIVLQFLINTTNF